MTEDIFETNFSTLKEYEVIPKDQLSEDLTDDAREAIKNLSGQEMEALKKIAQTTGSHIFLIDSGENSNRYTITVV